MRLPRRLQYQGNGIVQTLNNMRFLDILKKSIKPLKLKTQVADSAASCTELEANLKVYLHGPRDEPSQYFYANRPVCFPRALRLA